MEADKAARLTILIDTRRKEEFDAACAARGITASQMIREMIKGYLDAHGAQFTPVFRPRARRASRRVPAAAPVPLRGRKLQSR